MGTPGRTAPRPPGTVVVLLLALLASITAVVGCGEVGQGDGSGPPAAQDAAGAFLAGYVEPDGRVVPGPSSASDTDLDAAQALVLAGQSLGDLDLLADGLRPGQAVLDVETVETAAGRCAARGGRAATRLGPGPRRRPRRPDARRRRARRSGGALRLRRHPLPVRCAESCAAEDRALAARLAAPLRQSPGSAAERDLGGHPLTGDRSVVGLVGEAAALAAAGDAAGARDRLAAAADLQQEHPTHFGGAWAALGPALLTGTALGGCAALSPD